MLRIYFALLYLGAFGYQTCSGDTQTDDWRRQGFYRPRRNFPSQTNDNAFRSTQKAQSQSGLSTKFDQISSGTTNQNSERINPFASTFNQNFKTQSVFGSYNQHQNSFGAGSQNYKRLEPSGATSGQFGTNYRSQNQHSLSNTQDPISQSSFGRNSQNSFKASSQAPSSQNNFSSRVSQDSFASSFSQNPLRNNGRNSYVSRFSDSQITQRKDAFESSINHKAQNTFGNFGYVRSSLSNSFQSQNQFPLNTSASSSFSSFGANSAFAKNDNYRAPDYLPPNRFKAPEYLPPEKPRTTTFPPYVSPRTTTTTTRRPITTTTTTRPLYTTTTTRRPFYTTTTTKQPFYTTTTTRRPFYTTTTTKQPFYTTTTATRPYFTITTTKQPLYTTTTTKRTFFTTTTTKPPTTTRRPVYLPALAMSVPPEEEDDGNDITPDVMKFRTNQVSPAQAMKVPPEPEDSGEEIIDVFPSTTTTTSTTTPSTTTTTTPITSSSTTPATTPSITTITTTPLTTVTTPSPTTTTTPTTTNTSTTPSTTTTTTTITTTTTTTPSTTTSTTLSTTTSTTPSTSTTKTTTPSTTTFNPNRNLIEDVPTTTLKTETTYRTTSTSIAPSTTPYKASKYLPPLNTTSVPPSPAIANIVPPEPVCNPLDPSTYPFGIDHRNLDGNPCEPTPTTTTTKPPFRGPFYLPPGPDACIEPKKRVGRSSNNTLKLADLKGTPRPVWYAGIYKKTTNPYRPICGGSIIREDIVISAAHCFWDDNVGKQPAEQFAVAARKIYKPWTDTMDKRAQKSDVLDIKIPPRFLGAKTSFQEDLAILKLATPFTYNQGLMPICVDFDDDFDRQQMKAGHLGTIAGWGYTDAAGTPAVRLLWLELPYVEIEKCIRDSQDDFLKYITCDKVCAGENDTGKALCRGDSGGGLAFWQGEPGHATPYLRGIASTAPKADSECNVYAYASFTHVRAHRTFLRDHVPDIENCRFWG